MEPSGQWPHAPTHRLAETGTYIVTAGTYEKRPFFTGHDRLQALHNGLLKYAKKYHWRLEAWAVFPNHYHFIGHSPDNDKAASNLSVFLKHFHGRSSAWLNRLDRTPGRRIWHNFWDTRLTYERSYFARLNYVHQNPVKHGVVPVANQYPWCSAAWFERTATPAMVNSIYSIKIDAVNVLDNF